MNFRKHFEKIIEKVDLLGTKTSDYDEKLLKKGSAVEKEHTNSQKQATKIAQQHAAEFPIKKGNKIDSKYYDELDKTEKKLKKTTTKSFKDVVDELNENVNYKISLWLDDERNPKEKFIQQNFGAIGNEIWVKSVEEAKQYLSKQNVVSISFDNDLGENMPVGYDLAKWIEEMAFNKELPQLSWKIHSANPQGQKYIRLAMQNADKFWERLNETTMAGGVGSAFGSGVTSTATQFSGDTYASGDARMPYSVLKKKKYKKKPLVIRRTMPKTL